MLPASFLAVGFFFVNRLNFFIDRDECAGAPCGLLATCQDSLDSATIQKDKFVCTCTTPGWAYPTLGGQSTVTLNAGAKPGTCEGNFDP